eukprot:NODE_5893_length_298_cov_2.092369_g5281_i0.p1 GENE.NODE_5893_length_298_cov_2.092369_g5281_i0~~NODE_5893_length_298_cov_2.092369_g5281_i0.p1  ORF type:complete len:59 (+),score=6.90 NODE_5893_length_298_cov_2.092369_g5281_i0:99-275(+)
MVVVYEYVWGKSTTAIAVSPALASKKREKNRKLFPTFQKHHFWFHFGAFLRDVLEIGR